MNSRLTPVGKLVGIARRPRNRAPMEQISAGLITPEFGLEGDYKGLRSKNRAITILSKQSWEMALVELSGNGQLPDLSWTTRRANLLVDDLILPKARGAILQIGTILLEVTAPTQPCRRME